MSDFHSPRLAIDFIVTGSMRSGTTYLASILKSQDSMACIEDKPWSLIASILRSMENLSVFCTSFDAKFTYLGLPAPSLRNVRNLFEVYLVYCRHFCDLLGCELLGS